ncbi:MAG TPA: nodulation protein NfeD, partial [Bdellovibrionota bacterium]|nr:nodulation protein NfeD [Bdellovibrionota bacterium]
MNTRSKIIPLVLFIFSILHFVHAAPVAVIKIDGGINPASNDFIKMSIQEAQSKKAECLVIQLDTPGGLLSSTREIVQAILEAPLPVVVYVSPQGAHAGSAGVMITLAAHVAAMAPGTNIGAAHPVTGTGQDVEGEMKQKVTNDAAAFAESIAKARGRNTKWAIEAVRKSVSITAQDALEKNVIDVMAPNLQKLLEVIHGRSVKVQEKTVKLNTKDAETLTLEMNLKQKVVDTLADPNIAYLLMAVGGIGIYIELTHPGLVAPGVIGGICLILGFVSVQALPINYGG